MSLNLSLFSRVTLLGSRASERDAFLDETHLGSEGGVGDPGSGVARRHFLEHSVDLLEGKALSLRNQEICEENADDAEGAPHEENLGGQVGVLFID